MGVNFIFLRKNGYFSEVFSAFYGQRSVTAAWATRSPWSITITDHLFSDEHNCDNSPEPSEESQMLHLTSPLVISAVVLILCFLLVIARIVSSYKRTRSFHPTVQQTVEKDSPSSDFELSDPPPYTTVLRLGRSYQYCDQG